MGLMPILPWKNYHDGTDRFIRYQRHTHDIEFYDDDEMHKNVDLQNKYFNISYMAMLRRIETGQIKPQELDMIM
jgi:hypothetical protein